MQQIADALGITRTHVARALSGRGYVRRSLKQKILRVARQMNYRPNRSAVALATQRTMTIGLFMDLDPSYFGAFSPSFRIVLCLSDALERWGYSLKMMPPHAAGAEGIDGAICVFKSGLRHWAKVRRPSLPAVAILRHDAGSVAEAERLEMPWAAYDRRPGMSALAALCARKGLRRVGLLSFEMPRDNPGLAEIRAALAQHGLSLPDTDIFEIQRCPETLIAQMVELAPRLRALDLCVLRSNQVAVPFYQAAHLVGLRIPADLSLAGYDNAYYTDRFDPPVSSLQFSIEALCAQAAEAVTSAIAGEDFDRQIRIEAEFVDRGSIR